MSSFQIATTTVTFTVSQEGFSEQYQSTLRTWDCTLLLTLPTDYTTLVSMLSYPVSVRSCPGSAGVTMVVSIGGGAGVGTLTLDNVVGSPFNAVLTRLQRPSAYPGGGRRVAATFQETN